MTDSLSWSNITYDIPIPKKQLKQAAARAHDVEKADGSSHDEAVNTSDNPSHSPRPGLAPLAAGNRRILSGLSGSVKQQEMMAILGASGAGKTTLLNILSARVNKVGTIGGSVSFFGKDRDPATWKRTVGFVEQDDVMLTSLTVEEQLYYSARLRLPSSLYDNAARDRRVADTLEVLNLTKCRDTRIGDDRTRGVSGGERKRTAVGVELVSDTSLLLLDEPTSGLDSHSSLSLIQTLQQITRSRKGLSSVMTIHQPSWQVLSLFDRTQFLAQGRVYFDGKPSELIGYFTSLGYQLSEGTNPADWAIALAENPEKTPEGARRVHDLIHAWETKGATSTSTTTTTSGTVNSATSGATTPTLAHSPLQEHGSKTSAAEDPASPVSSHSLEVYSHWPTSWLSELQVLTHRNLKQLSRDTITLYATVAQTVALLIIIGFAFFRLGASQSDVLARVGVLYFLPINTSFAVLFPILTPLALQRAVMRRERSGGLYRTSSFFLSKWLVEVPSNVLQKVPFFVILYWMVGLRASAGAFFIFLGVNCLHTIVAVCLGLFIGGLSPSLDLSNILAPFVTVVFLLFGGNLLPSPPPWFIWLHYISPITYTYSALSQNEYIGQTYSCEGIQSGSSQCYATGEQILDQYKLATFSIGENVGFNLAIAAVLTLLAYLALRITAHPKFRFVELQKKNKSN